MLPPDPAHKGTLLVRLIGVCCLLATSAAPAATPDQVLVLYNKDWTEDLDGSEPGQDSLEVAKYYVEQHTDPVSGDKPYLLGLTCKHEGKRHLNRRRLPESSNDNIFGVIYTGPGEGPEMTDKRHPPFLAGTSEIILKSDSKRRVNWSSVIFKVGPTDNEKDAETIWQDEKRRSPLISVRRLKSNGRDVRGARVFKVSASEPVYLWYSAEDLDGDVVVKHEAIKLWPKDFFTASTMGPDGVRDDLCYLEDIDIPLKKFLLDSDNALPDGTPLKQHILYIVVCYGLPRTVESAYGIMRGITRSMGNFGDGSALDSRLISLMYDYEHMRYAGRHLLNFSPFHISTDSQGFKGAIPIGNLRIRAGFTLNIYKHPKSFRPQRFKKRSNIRMQAHHIDPEAVYAPVYEPGDEKHPHFTTTWRDKQNATAFLYSACRVDAGHPNDAKRLVDNAIYASEYFTPKLGKVAFKPNSTPPCSAAARFALDELKILGFQLPETHKGSPDYMHRANMFFSLLRSSPMYYEDGPVIGDHGFYPGAVAYAIKSANRRRRGHTQFARYFSRHIECGATVTGGLSGEGHIHTASWWDDKIMFHHLFRGYQLGECFLMAGYGLVDWVAAYVGDPLYQPDLSKTVPDESPPVVRNKNDIHVDVIPTDGNCCAMVTCKLDASPRAPEMVEVFAEYWRGDAPRRMARDTFFTTRPEVILRGLAPETTWNYRIVLTDPYGNTFDSEEAFGPLTIKTPSAPKAKTLIDLAMDAKPELHTVNSRDPARISAHIQGEDLSDISGDDCLRLGGKRYLSMKTGTRTVATNDDIPPPEHGEIHLAFALDSEHRHSYHRILDAGGISLRTRSNRKSDRIGQLRFTVAGETALSHEPLDFEYDKRYDLILRWRRNPLTREIYIKNRDGNFVLAGANNRYPWREEPIKSKLVFGMAHGRYFKLVIRNNAVPSSEEANAVYPRRLDLEKLKLD